MSVGAGPGDGTPEMAGFATARVGGPGRRLPVAALGWVVVLVGVVAIGLSGRAGDTGAGPGGAAGATMSVAIQPASRGPTTSVGVVQGSRSPGFNPASPFPRPRNAEATSLPGPINLDATRQPSAVFVHGDVFAQQVTWVSVSLQTLDGQVGGWASVSIPGAAGDGRDHRPALGFDVELAVPTTMAAGVLVVQANAHNAEGGLIASTRVRLEPEM